MPEKNALILKWDDARTTETATKVQRQVLATRNVMIVRHTYPPGALIPIHSHPQEQITYIEKGTLYYEVDDMRYYLMPGDVISVPSNVHHGGTNKGSETVVTLNIFHPILEYLIPEAKTLDLMVAKPPSDKTVEPKKKAKGKKKR